MKILTRSLVAALALAFGFGSAVFAYEGATVTAANDNAGGSCGCATACDACDSCCGYDACCDTCCDGGIGWGLFGEAELLFLRYHRADGVRVGVDPTDVGGEFDFAPAYRLSFGTIAPGGLGFRARYFEYDHAEAIGDGVLGVDAYTLDAELFEAFALNNNWAMEASAGFRYLDFQEDLLDTGDFDHLTGMDGIGLVSGMEVRRAVGGIGLLYARTRASVVQGDKTIFNGGVAHLLPDVTAATLELAAGGEMNYQLANGSVAFLRSGVELQNWYNVSNAFAANDGASLGDDFWGAASDAGFGGFTLGAGLSY